MDYLPNEAKICSKFIDANMISLLKLNINKVYRRLTPEVDNKKNEDFFRDMNIFGC